MINKTFSNTTGTRFELCYRMPGEKTQILKVIVLPYALNNEISFPNETYYDEFMLQNNHYFKGTKPILIEGKSMVSKIEKLSEALEQEQREKIQSELKSLDDNISSVAEETTGKKVEIVVSKNKAKNKNIR